MQKKILVIFILIMSYIIVNFIYSNNVFAVNQTITTDLNSIDSIQYPEIKEKLQNLQNSHPNWKFKILYTDLQWKDVIANEYVGHGDSPRNLVPTNNSNYDGDWICSICGKGNTYDSGNWYCASESAIAYMMDPRNSTNNTDIFQFMELSYSDCNVQTLRNMVSNSFLNNESYINTIITAAQTYNVNPYYIVARILQEQGRTGSVAVQGKGYNGQYIGYYNVFNIGASGKGKDNVILNGLKKAKSYGWTTIESSIMGGVEIIASSYIAKGQNTLYFQKFDVENSDGNLYWHQYMQNILAAQKEGTTLRTTFEEFGTIDGEYTFIIPLYKNMPQTASVRPSTTSSPSQTVPPDSNTELVRVNVTNSLRIRNEPNGAQTLGWVYKDEIITRLSKATEKVGGTYWDYVMKADGTKGYTARETYDYESTYKLYLVPIEPEVPKQPEVPEEPEVPQEPENPDNVVKTDKVKMNKETNDIATIPNATVKDVIELMGEEVVIKDANGNVLSQESVLSTGCTINDTYTIAVLGDANGDGKTDTKDAARALKTAVGSYNLEGVYYKALDINADGKVDTKDAARLLKTAVGKYEIQL